MELDTDKTGLRLSVPDPLSMKAVKSCLASTVDTQSQLKDQEALLCVYMGSSAVCISANGVTKYNAGNKGNLVKVQLTLQQQQQHPSTTGTGFLAP